MNKNFLCFCAGSVFFLGLAVIKPVTANEEDDDKTMKQALEDAQKAAAKAGIKVPDATKQLEAMAEEEDKEEAREKKAATPKTPPVTSPLTKLPSWIPAIPDFQAAPKATKKEEDGVETGKMTGTSSLSPEAIADGWHTAATARKLSFERQDSNINGKKSVHLRISDSNGSGGEAELELAPGKNTAVEIDYKVKLAKSPAPQ